MKLWESHKENSLFVNNKVFLNSFAISLSSFASIKKFMRFFALNFALFIHKSWKSFLNEILRWKRRWWCCWFRVRAREKIELLCKHFIFIYLNDSVTRDVRRATGTMEKQGEWEKLFLALLLRLNVLFIWVLVMHLYVSIMMVLTFLCAFVYAERRLRKFS